MSSSGICKLLLPPEDWFYCYCWISISLRNYSFLIELYQVLIVPLSKAARNEPIGSNTENCIEVMEFYVLVKFSTLPIVNLTLPWASNLTPPKSTFPRDVPTAKFIPLGLKTAAVTTSFLSASNLTWYYESTFSVSKSTSLIKPDWCPISDSF